MKSIPQGLPFCLALVLGVGVSVLDSGAGLGASGALIFGALFSTVVFSLVGGRMRIWLAAILTVPPFVLSSSDNIRGSLDSTLEDAVWHTPPTHRDGFWCAGCIAFSHSIYDLLLHILPPPSVHTMESTARPRKNKGEQNGCRQRLGGCLSCQQRLAKTRRRLIRVVSPTT